MFLSDSCCSAIWNSFASSFFCGQLRKLMKGWLNQHAEWVCWSPVLSDRVLLGYCTWELIVSILSLFEGVWYCLWLRKVMKQYTEITTEPQHSSCNTPLNFLLITGFHVLTIVKCHVEVVFFFSFALDWAALTEWKCSFIRPNGGGFIYFQYSTYKLICYSKEEGEERQQTWGPY